MKYKKVLKLLNKVYNLMSKEESYMKRCSWRHQINIMITEVEQRKTALENLKRR